MPVTKEFTCDNNDCGIDMFEIHFTYDYETKDPQCPYCGMKEKVNGIELD